MPSPRAQHRLPGLSEKLELLRYVGRGQYWDPEVAVPKVAFWRLSCLGVFQGFGVTALMWDYKHKCVPSPGSQPGTVTAGWATGCPWGGIFVADLSPLHPVRSQGWILQKQAHTAGKTELFFLFLVIHLPLNLPSVCVQGQQSFGMPGELQGQPCLEGTSLGARLCPPFQGNASAELVLEFLSLADQS